MSIIYGTLVPHVYVYVYICIYTYICVSLSYPYDQPQGAYSHARVPSIHGQIRVLRKRAQPAADFRHHVFSISFQSSGTNPTIHVVYATTSMLYDINISIYIYI